MHTNATLKNAFSTLAASSILLLFVFSAEAAYLRDFPVTVTQPDGTTLDLYASGDEYHNWLHDKDGYTIMRSPVTGYFVYAVRADGSIAASTYRVGAVSPAAVGIKKHVNLSPGEMMAKRISKYDRTVLQPAAPATGTINNIVIFIRFSGEAEFGDSIATYDSMFNSIDAPLPVATAQAGTSSLYSYYKEVSYGQLDVSTTFYPAPTTMVVSYQDSQPRGYYQPYNAITNDIGYANETERTEREHLLLKNAVDAVSSQIPADLNVDGDGDGEVDNVCFIVKGGPDGWSDLLWPHQWVLYTQNAYINGKQVWTYNLQMQNSLLPSNVGVLAHEMFHSIGSPDLYHYSYDGLQPVWEWDLMERDLNPPQHMSAYMKKTYGGWIASIPEITTSGTYTLNPLTSATNNAYKIASPNSTTEYFVVEYRKRTGTFETSLPGEGLLVYRINTTVTGNAEGPPDEVYIYRPGGTTTDDGTPLNATFSSTNGRTAINDATDPSSFLSSGAAGGLNISQVGAIGNVISFYVTLPSQAVTPPTVATTSASAIIYSSATLNGTVNPNNSSTAVTFEYGTTTSYGSTVTATGSPLTGNSVTPVSKAITGLSPNTLYHYRVKGVNSEGTSYGEDMTFTTTPVCAVVADGGFEAGSPNPSWTEFSSNFGTPLCDEISCGSAWQRTGSWWAWFGGIEGWVEDGSVTQNIMIPGGTTPRLEFYLDIPYSSGNDTDFIKVLIDGSEIFNALEGDPIYSAGYVLTGVDLSAYADGGIHTLSFESSTTGTPTNSNFMLDDVSISCVAGSIPGVKTGAAGSVTSSGATLSGIVTARGADTTPTFQYGTTAAYGNWAAAAPATVSGSADTAVAAPVSGLSAFTTYHYRLRGQNSSGLSYGIDRTFVTQCAGSPAQVDSTGFSSIQGAVNSASDGSTIKVTAATFSDSISFAGLLTGTVRFVGGYDCSFNPTSVSSTIGQLTLLDARTVIVDKIVIH